MIKRVIEDKILEDFNKGKGILIFGPRQVGKTTLLKSLEERIDEKVLFFNGDEHDVRELFQTATSAKLKAIIGNYKYIFIDEAQRILNIGLTLKLIIDNIPSVQVVATGSSAFELANKIKEPLTGRKFEYFLFPFSLGELKANSDILSEMRLLEDRIIYGAYPEVVMLGKDRVRTLKSLSDSYLYKDLLSYEQIKKPGLLLKLLQALALQIGSEVSYNELSQIIGADKETVEKYIDLLEKAFVVYKLGSFSRNLRNELKKSKKIYFYDTGIRNALIGNFNSLNLRTDTGALWENYFISERLKSLTYSNFYGNRYFWRTHSRQEIDYIEEADGLLNTFEIKWNKRKKAKFPESFKNTYPNSSFTVITRENYYEYL